MAIQTTSSLQGTPTTSSLGGTPTLISTQSSWAHSYGYDDRTGSLFIRYKDKRGRPTITARYDNVPRSVWLGLVSAPSKGTFVHASGLYRHPYRIVG